MTVTLLRSLRRWLLVLVFLLGVQLVALSAIGYKLSGEPDGALYAAVGLTGGLVALVAGLRAFLTLFGGSPQATTDESSPGE